MQAIVLDAAVFLHFITRVNINSSHLIFYQKIVLHADTDGNFRWQKTADSKSEIIINGCFMPYKKKTPYQKSNSLAAALRPL